MTRTKVTEIQYRYARARVDDYLRGDLRYSREAFDADMRVVKAWESR